MQAISDPQSTIQSIPIHNRVAMINFDDGWVSQYTLGKPILDEFGYKASYFLPCGHIGLKDKYLSWAQQEFCNPKLILTLTNTICSN